MRVKIEEGKRRQLPNVKCKKCGGKLFNETDYIKSPETLICANCGKKIRHKTVYGKTFFEYFGKI